MEFSKAVNEHDNLSKPLAPLINSLTISVNIFVFEEDSCVDCSSDTDEPTE